MAGLGGRIAGRNVESAWSFEVFRIIDEDTAEIHSKVMVAMTQQELADNNATLGNEIVKWDFLLKSPGIVKKLHERQTLATIPGKFVHQGRSKQEGRMIDTIAEAPAEKATQAAKAVATNKTKPNAAAKEDPDAKKDETELTYRSWTDNKGRSLEAAFIAHQGGKVTLRQRDGKELTLSIFKLSAADHDWVLAHDKQDR